MRLLYIAILGLAVNLGLLLPGLFQTVLTVTGTLEPDGIAAVAPKLLKEGVSQDTIKSFRPLLNPLVSSMAGDDEKLKELLLSKLEPELVKSLSTSGSRMEVYRQSRSILGSVQHLYKVGSHTAATLILLFSVIVPFGKIAMVLRAMCQKDSSRRRRILKFVAAISKWSMADVFAVALFITFLAARASQEPPAPGEDPPLVTFSASFGPGFFWFAGYCLVSLATHQLALRKWAHLSNETPAPAKS